jgi:hypothetical protein
MTAFRKLLLSALAALAPLPSAFAVPEPTVDDAFRSLAAQGEANCISLQQRLDSARKGGNAAQVDGLESGYHMLCVCAPAQMNGLRSSYSPAQLASKLSQSNVMVRYKDEVGGRCAAEELRSTYKDHCAQRFAANRTNSAKYCQCMSDGLKGLPDAEFRRLGLESSDYAPRAAEAQKKGVAPPEPTPVLKRFLAKERACRAP